jgi:hypothetical protein
VRVASGSDTSSASISLQLGQLRIAAQASAEAVATGVVNLTFEPRTLLVGQ